MSSAPIRHRPRYGKIILSNMLIITLNITSAFTDLPINLEFAVYAVAFAITSLAFDLVKPRRWHRPVRTVLGYTAWGAALISLTLSFFACAGAPLA